MTLDTLQPGRHVAPLLLDGDTPRVHKNDPTTSHLAADKSQRTAPSVRDRVLQIIADYGPMAAFEVCDLYAARARRLGWPHVHHESPRKRMSELRKDGLLVDTGERRINRENSPEIVLALKESAS